MRRGPAVTVAITAAVVAVDQIAKSVARSMLEPLKRSVPILGGLLKLTFTRNTGAAFGMLAGGRAGLILVSLAAVAYIGWYLVRKKPQHPWLVIALGLVCAGAIGNLIDRISVGWVTDFLQFPFDFPVFNVADMSVVAGVAMLVWWLLFGPESHDRPATEPAAVEVAPHTDDDHEVTA